MLKFRYISQIAFLTALYTLSLSAAKRPNILFVYADDQRYDAFSTVQREQGEKGRFPWFKTPHLDKLAAEGVRFRNAFVVNSLCSPSRAVNLTGRYNHLNGIASNFRDFPVDNVTHASLLRKAGYRTAYIGKWHMGNQKERPGFDYAASYIGHSHYFDSTFVVQGKKVKTKGWIDDVATDYAVDFLQKQKGSNKPWLMVVGFKSPHGPFDPPPRAKDRFKNAQAEVVPNCNVPPPYNPPEAKEALKKKKFGETMPTNLNYLRCVSAMDECVGRLMEALEANGQKENTVVIFTSDNGFYLNEHGLGDKRSAYEESMRVPFVVRYPKLGGLAVGRVCDRMVLNLDLVRSILDLAGVEAPADIQGRSWKPLLTRDVKDWRKSWFYEYFAEAQRGCRIPDIKGIRTESAKLITYLDHPEWTEMFDLTADPYETKNLYKNPEYKDMRKELEKELKRLSEETAYVIPDYTDRPYWWDLPGGADWKPEKTPVLKLAYEPGGEKNGVINDSSGNKNVGRLKGGVKVVKMKNGEETFSFDGTGYIDVAKSESLDPSRKAVSVEVVVHVTPENNGVLTAFGGASLGYSLAIQNGHAVFSVNSGVKPVAVKTKKALDGRIKLTGIFTAEKQVELLVNGRTVGKKKVRDFIGRAPNESIQIGADTGTQVIEPPIAKFTGKIESVKIYSGEKR